MKRFFGMTAIFFTGLITASCFYRPASIALYKIKEPHFRYPVNIENVNKFVRNDASGDGSFGAKRRNGRFHAGIDFIAPIGSAVYASKSGTAFKLNVPSGYGKYVMIYHPDGYQTIYAHLSEWNVFSTQRVHRGDIIGYIGKTGNASSRSVEAHIHFEVRKDGLPVNPDGLLRQQ